MKRDYSQWVDELIHPDFFGFRADCQLRVSDSFPKFQFLWSLRGIQPPSPQWNAIKFWDTAAQGPLESVAAADFSRMVVNASCGMEILRDTAARLDLGSNWNQHFG